METLKAICSRTSCRAFTDQPVETEKLEKVVAAGSLAAIGRRQFENVFLTVIRDRALLDELEAATREMRGNPEMKAFYGAPVLVSVAIKGDDFLGKENCACVVENMLIAATDLGLGNIYLHSPCALFEKQPELFKKLGAPEGFVPGAFMALGYAAKETEVRELACRLPARWI